MGWIITYFPSGVPEAARTLLTRQLNETLIDLCDRNYVVMMIHGLANADIVELADGGYELYEDQ
jgi:hypothetical protein